MTVRLAEGIDLPYSGAKFEAKRYPPGCAEAPDGLNKNLMSLFVACQQFSSDSFRCPACRFLLEILTTLPCLDENRARRTSA